MFGIEQGEGDWKLLMFRACGAGTPARVTAWGGSALLEGQARLWFSCHRSGGCLIQLFVRVKSRGQECPRHPGMGESSVVYDLPDSKSRLWITFSHGRPLFMPATTYSPTHFRVQFGNYDSYMTEEENRDFFFPLMRFDCRSSTKRFPLPCSRFSQAIASA
jgi:hypothetical protein